MPAQTIAARQLPAIRAELVEWLSDPRPDGGPDVWSRGFPDLATVRRERAAAGRWATALRAAELYYAAADMTRLAVAAGEALPSYRLHPEDLPSPQGLLVWAETVTGSTRGGAVTNAPIIAATWTVRGNGVVVRTWARREDWLEFMAEGDPRGDISDLTPAQVRALRIHQPQPITAMAESHMPFGQAPGWLDDAPPEGLSLHELEDHARTSTRLQQAERALVVTWLLMGQTLATVSDVEPPRSSAHFIRRIDPNLLTATRYVQLRHRGYAPEPGGDAAGGRAWRHRWLVRGHWKNQWYASRHDHRPIWINPYVKGPDGAPLFDPDKLVNILRR